MPDLRERVEEDRGLIKKIQLVIPGYRGYRQREDLRIADSLLRTQLADRIAKAREELEGARKAMADKYLTDGIDQVGALISRFRSVEGHVRHAEQGYSGFSPGFRFEKDELNALYKNDAAAVENVLLLAEGRTGADATRSQTQELTHSTTAPRPALSLREGRSLYPLARK